MDRRIFFLGGHFVLALMFLICLPAPGQAQEAPAIPEPSFSTQIGEESRITYFDLVKLLCPSLRTDGTADATIPIRTRFGRPKKQAFRGAMTVSFKPHRVKSGKEELLFLDVTLNGSDINPGSINSEEVGIAALFRTGSTVELLDAMPIQFDRSSSITEWFDLREKGAHDAFLVENTHWNAGESYLQKELVLIHRGRFQTITNVFLYETQGCGMTYSERVSFKIVPDRGSLFPNVLVTVKLVKEPDEDHCEKRTGGYTRFFRGTYRWNQSKGRYVGNDAELDKLAKFNERRIDG